MLFDDMLKNRAKQLLIKYRSGNCTAEEQALVERWLFNFQDHPSGIADERIDDIGEEIWARLPQPQIRPLYHRRWLRAGVAAMITIGLTAGIYFTIRNHASANQSVVFVKDIAPGSAKAVLTLADGKKILLNPSTAGQLASAGHTVISNLPGERLVYATEGPEQKQTSLAYHTISIPVGGQYQVVLADGTHVWLNAASSIKYPVAFGAGERRVELTGEAYFEVVHDAARPFRVVSSGQTVEVLGTHFNVEAYTDEKTIKTTLLQGKVLVTRDGSTATLKPGEQAQSDRPGGAISVTAVDADEAVAWKNGLFQYNKASIESIMHDVARWYDVDISYDNGQHPVKTFTGNISRNSTLSQLLHILSYTGLRFKMEGRRITVITE